jgi:hypothetical protein
MLVMDTISVLDGRVLLASDDPTGKVSGGFLRLRGPLIVTWTEFLEGGPFYDVRLKSNSLLATLNFDHNEARTPTADKPYLLSVSRPSGSSLFNYGFHGIVIEPTNKAKGQFYPRGYVQGHPRQDLQELCEDSIGKLKESEYERVEPDDKFGYVFNITLA